MSAATCLRLLCVLLCLVGSSGCHLGSGDVAITKIPPGMELSVAQCSATIEAFIAQGRFKYSLDAADHGDHSVICGLGDDGKLAITILNSTPGQKLEKLPPFEATLDRRRATFAVFRAAGTIPVAAGDADTTAGAPQIRSLVAQPPAIGAGSPAKGTAMTVSGTLGWNIILNGQLVCLSNHHVLSIKPNPPAVGEGILLNARPVATLYRYNSLNFISGAQHPVNYWDIAIGVYNPTSAAGAFNVACQNGAHDAYPTALSPCHTVALNQSFHFIGAASGCQNTMRLLQVCYGAVSVYGGKAWFEQQLMFPMHTAGRDSGAIIIRDSDNTVTGIHMAIVQVNNGATWYSMANPLYRAQLTNTGMKTVAGNTAAFPSFTPTYPPSGLNCFGGGPCAE